MYKTKRMGVLGALAGWLCLCVCSGITAQTADEAQIERYSRKANQALAAKDLDGAAVALEELARLTPNVPEVHANLGMVYYTQGRFDPAAQAFQRALKLNRTMPNAETMLGICLAELGRYREAVPILEPAFQHPTDNQVGRLTGLELQKAYTGLKQYAKASQVFDELLIRYPDDPEILYFASRLYADRADYTMQQLVAIAPRSVWVAQAKAAVRESLKEYDLAIIEYRNALRIDPRQPGVHYRLGRVLLLRSKDSQAREEALHEFEHELAIQPQSSDAEYEIGEIYRQRGELEQALEHFSRAVEYDPEFEDAQIALGRVLAHLERPQEALPHLLAAVRINPENEVSHYLLASVYRALGDTSNRQKETALFQKLHAVSPHTGLRPPPPELAAPEVTKQTLGSESVTQPEP